MRWRLAQILLAFFCIQYLIHTPVYPAIFQNIYSDSTDVEAIAQNALNLLRQRQFDDAMLAFNRAANIYESKKLWYHYFDQKIFIGIVLAQKQQFDSALHYFEDIGRSMEEQDFFDYFIQFRLNQEIGEIHGRNRNTLASIDAFIKNIPLTNDHYPKDSTEKFLMLAKTCNNVAVGYAEINSYEISNKYYDSALVWLRTGKDLPTELEHVIYLNKANNLRYLGYYEEAVEHFNRSESIMDSIPARQLDEIDRGLFYWYLGNFYLNKNQNQEDLFLAKSYTDTARMLFTSVDPDIFFLDYCDYNDAEIGINQGEFKKSLEYIDQAEKRILKYFGPDYGELGYLEKLRGQILAMEGNFVSAHHNFDEAIKLYKKIDYKDFDEIASTYTAKAKAYQDSKSFDEALTTIQNELSMLLPAFQPASNLQNPESTDLFNRQSVFAALETKGNILLELFEESQNPEHVLSASECFELAIHYINLSRSEIVSLKSKSQFVARKISIYEQALRALITAYELTGADSLLAKAFITSDKNKSVSLYERISDNRKLISSNIPHSWQQNESKLLTEINYLEKRKFDLLHEPQTNQQEVAQLESSLFELKQNYQQYLNQLKSQYPYQSDNAQNNVLDLEALGAQMLPGQAIIEYFVGDDYVYSFSLSKEINVNKIERSPEFNDDINRLIRTFQDNRFDARLSAKVAAKIISPHLSMMEKNQVKELIIIPDGILSYLPFEALIKPNHEQEDEDHIQDFLINDYIFSYYYSANLIQFFQKNMPDHPGELSYMGFAPSFNQQSNPLLATRSADNIRIASQLQYLPQAIDEVEFSAKLMGGLSFLNENATESKFKEIAKNASIIHLATHAIIDDENPMYSKIVFSEEAGSIEDGLLHTYELYNMNLKAQLACLSACNTGFGSIQAGEGVVSLARGFIYAGVPNIMMSLWSVPDNATGEIIKVFYQELEKGKGKAEALRIAKLHYLANADANTNSPYYWAAFTLVGDNQPMNTTRGMAKYFVWILGLAVLVIAIFLIRKYH